MSAEDRVGEEVDGADAAETPPTEDAGGQRRGRAWAVVALLLAALVATGWWAWRASERADDAETELALDRDARLAAGSFVQTLLTYDFEELDAARAAVAERVTDRFDEELGAAFEQDLAAAIAAEEASSRASIRNTFLLRDDPGEARAIVIAEAEIRSARGAVATIESVLEVVLVRSDGRWLVDELISLGSRDVTEDPA